MEILNLAGSAYDFSNVLFAVLQDCEHKRRSLLANEAEPRLMEIARRKLSEVHESYQEAGGTGPYWEMLEREILETAMPQYITAAIEQNRLERTNYDLWRGGDPLCRGLLGLAGLALGGIIIAIPWIPIFEDAFAFALAGGGFFYPELKRLLFDYRHTRLLNRLVGDAEKYQKNSRIHYVSNARMEEELRSLERAAEKPGPRRVEEAGGPPAEPPHKQRA